MATNGDGPARGDHAAIRALLEATTDAVMLCDADGTVVAANAAAAHRFGVTPEEFLGANAFALAPPDVAASRRRVLAEMVKAGEPVRFRDEREGRVLQNTVYPTVEPPGRPTRFAIFSQDITTQTRAEENQRRLELRLQQSQKLESLGILAGGIAHDFNNILTGLLGNVDMALCQLPADSPVQGFLKDVKQEARRAAGLTNQMLAYSGKGRFVVEDVDINEMVRGMSSLLRSSISKKVELRFELASELPGTRADATQLQQILLNLVSNASEAIGESAGRVAVRTYQTKCETGCVVCASLDTDLPAGTYVTIEVTDTGCGMDEATRARIFDPFFTTKLTGRGLGLAAVQGIVRAHGGAVLIESEPGEGTTFTVLVPALDHRAAVEVPTRAKTPWRGAGLVLVADDEDMVRKVIGAALDQAGFSVLTASDGAEAIERFRKHAAEIACVVLDLNMPRMDGAEAYRAIRKLHSDVPVILISGYGEQASVEGLDVCSLSGFIQKPFDASTLTEKVRVALAAK